METPKIDWENFKVKIEEFKSSAKELDKVNPRQPQEFEVFSNEYKSWRDLVLEFLIDQFGVRHDYVLSFKLAHSNGYSFPGMQKTWDQKSRESKQALKNDFQTLVYITKLVSVSDLLIKDVDIEVRKNYDSQEILGLLLEKLYDLYDDNVYPVLPILEGNGIVLKKIREEYDYVKILENRNLVRSNNIGKQADAQLTIEGKLLVEEHRKKFNRTIMQLATTKMK